MIAPKGFEYYSFGSSMFTSNKNQGIAYNKMIKNNEIFHFSKDIKPIKITLKNMVETQIDSIPELISKYNQQMSLAWHYTMKGNQLKIQ